MTYEDQKERIEKNGVELLECASNVGHCLGIAEMGCGQGLWEIFYLFKTRGKQRHYVSICCIWVYILFKPCFFKCSAILTSSSPMSVLTLFIWYLLVMQIICNFKCANVHVYVYIHVKYDNNDRTKSHVYVYKKQTVFITLVIRCKMLQRQSSAYI